MAYPFKPLSTEKLKKAFKIMVERNCGIKDTNKCRKKHSGIKIGKQTCLSCPGFEKLDTAINKFLSPY